MRKRARKAGRIRGRRDWDAATEASKDAHYRALEAISSMRSQQLTLTQAAAAAGTTPETVRRYADAALRRDGRRYQASAGDRLYRRMAVQTATGRVDVDVRGSRAASLVGAHHNAIGRYLATGERTHLAPFVGETVGGRELLTDPQQIERLAAQRELDIDDIYPRT